jgi:ATP-dependent DNA helicase RecG
VDATELLALVARGEDGTHQFKVNVHNAKSLGQEFAAFSNSGGGTLLLGVTDDGQIPGLTTADIARLNQLVSNAASQCVRPPVNPRTENVQTPSGLVMVIHIADGLSRPYLDTAGSVWVKSGADKRSVTSREELQRMFQSAGLVHADETPAKGLTVADLDLDYFGRFFQQVYGQTLDEQPLPLAQLLENMNLMRAGELNLSAALLFAKAPQFRLPLFTVKAIAYPGVVPDEHNYIDSRDIVGKLGDVFAQSLSFVLGNLHHVQGSGDVNSLGQPEVPRIVLEELLANALIHRDYFVPAPVRLFIYRDRIELISPGHLPNNLTVENIKRGNSNIRNPILACCGRFASTPESTSRTTGTATSSASPSLARPSPCEPADTMEAACYALLSDNSQLRYGVWGRSTVTAISVERDSAASPVQNSVAPDSSAVAR